jgi:hypothetical protein
MKQNSDIREPNRVINNTTGPSVIKSATATAPIIQLFSDCVNSMPINRPDGAGVIAVTENI